MGKAKLFIENFLVYGLGGIICRIIPLVMVPIITRLMPNTEYFGLSDLSVTVTSFASALAIIGMYDAMFRMFFEKEERQYKEKICSTTLMFTLVTSAVVFVLMLIFKNAIAQFFFGDAKYFYLVYITAIATLVGATNGIISAPTRMQNKRKIFLITNTISPLISYAVSIPLLLKGFYVIALPLASVVSGLAMEIAFWILNRGWFSFKKFDFKLLRQLLVIAVPLFPNFLIYWIFNSSDRVMIANILDVGQSGIYSVGSKLGHASQLIYTAFAGGWQYFSFSTMKEENQVRTNSLIFEYLGIVSFLCTMLVCIVSRCLYSLLFTDEYVSAYIISPYLFLAPLLQMLFQVAANQFLVIKKTWPNMLILSCGAALNIVLNFILIPKIGIEGAAIATLIGYLISDVVCIIVLCRMKLMQVSVRFMVSVLFMAIFILLWRLYFLQNESILVCVFMLMCGCWLLLYKKDIGGLIGRKGDRNN